MSEADKTTEQIVEEQGYSPVAEVRDNRGRYAQGYTPPGAKPWPKGKSGNPKGSTSIGTRLSRLVNSYGSEVEVTDKNGNVVIDPETGDPKMVGKYSVAQLKKIIDESGDPCKIAAAVRVIRSMEDDRLGLDTFTTLIDYTDGKPHQSVNIKHETEPDSIGDLLTKATSVGRVGNNQ
ncbi:hypothetical protein KS4_23340 [Poriferisphaera corsica]|uniref:Uncharacterized protein n=1 Tax=Poriferisphaera corsica TaxID=2528020 RepID=A0A517YVK7_9BACT|nr:hypothetical protein [Poriferisphaera corsica]QDU34267.1 hypothetical protein KS4_23340 [Poriferisphaera corsica]